MIRQQAKEDLASSDPMGAVEVPEAGQSEALSAVMENVRQAMKRDRKLTGLKKLQGVLHCLSIGQADRCAGQIWQSGYENGELKGE